MALPIQLTTLTTIAARKAAPKLRMPRPGRKAATRPSIAAFTTSRKRPSVSNVNGSVSRTAIGLMIALTTPSRSAARIRVVGLETLMPSIHSVASQRPSAAINVRRMKRVTGALWPGSAKASARLPVALRPAENAGLHLGVLIRLEHHAVAAATLRAVQVLVRDLERARRGAARQWHDAGAADADRQPAGIGRAFVRLVERLHGATQLAGERLRRVLAESGSDQRHLLTAVPCDQVAGASDRTQRLRDAPQG